MTLLVSKVTQSYMSQSKLFLTCQTLYNIISSNKSMEHNSYNENGSSLKCIVKLRDYCLLNKDTYFLLRASNLDGDCTMFPVIMSCMLYKFQRGENGCHKILYIIGVLKISLVKSLPQVHLRNVLRLPSLHILCIEVQSVMLKWYKESWVTICQFWSR